MTLNRAMEFHNKVHTPLLGIQAFCDQTQSTQFPSLSPFSPPLPCAGAEYSRWLNCILSQAYPFATYGPFLCSSSHWASFLCFHHPHTSKHYPHFKCCPLEAFLALNLEAPPPSLHLPEHFLSLCNDMNHFLLSY